MQKEQAKDLATPSRRGFFMGAAGAAAAAVTALPGIPVPSAELNKLPPAPENGGGYSLSEHVKRYYQTTRV
ncbi:formate dehydrogenase [Limnohabitans sp.]|uniref:formate dehydrogenase n=1 Tax=Limnohabitans sp. TaxID=1907725 RepID=UPI00286ECC35|nr:formate dehydrogenase [Limnohabitans sp.]